MLVKALRLTVIGLCLAGAPIPAVVLARPAVFDAPADSAGIATGDTSLPTLQCVPYARQVTGINLRGDALTWWSQAEGRYARGSRPAVGAVMSFHPHGRMEFGHVAAVSRVLDSRTVLLRHANWSPIDGRRGQIERDVRAVDVSPGNDWSAVRVWYAPLGDLGTTHWPVDGFIYNRKAPARQQLVAQARIGADFLDGIVPEGKGPNPRKAARRELADETPLSRALAAPGPLKNDPIGRIIASRMR